MKLELRMIMDEQFLQFSRSLPASKEKWCKFVAGTLQLNGRTFGCKRGKIETGQTCCYSESRSDVVKRMDKKLVSLFPCLTLIQWWEFSKIKINKQTERCT
jgi:hypothetical protein